VLKAMLDDVGDSFNVASVYEPFQVLLRQIMTAAVSYYAMQGSAELAALARELLESGRLDSPSVARAPTPAEVASCIIRELSGTGADMHDIERQWRSDMASIIADAMDCAYKQAIAAPQTVGSMFARKDSGSMQLTPREVVQVEQTLGSGPEQES
jgi:hypothetical protein